MDTVFTYTGCYADRKIKFANEIKYDRAKRDF